MRAKPPSCQTPASRAIPCGFMIHADRRFRAPFRGLFLALAFGLAALMAFLLALAEGRALAASAGATASVTITGQAAVGTVTAITLTLTTPALNPTTGLEAGAGTTGSGPPGLPSGPPPALGSLNPGVFSVTGASGQVFSLRLPRQIVLVTPQGPVLLRDFAHSAGNTPAIRPDGGVQIALNAQVETDPSVVLPLLLPAAGTSEDTLVLELAEVEIDGTMRQVAVRRPNPFAPPDTSDQASSESIIVVISYN